MTLKNPPKILHYSIASCPLDAIKLVYNALKSGGEAIFDSLIIDGEQEIALCPMGRYAKMPNVYFIPTLRTFEKRTIPQCQATHTASGFLVRKIAKIEIAQSTMAQGQTPQSEQD